MTKHRWMDTETDTYTRAYSVEYSALGKDKILWFVASRMAAILNIVSPSERQRQNCLSNVEHEESQSGSMLVDL